MESSDIHIESIDLDNSKDATRSSQLQPTSNESTINENFTRTFSSLIIDQLNEQDVKQLIQTQRKVLQKLDLTNKNISMANNSSIQTFNTYALRDFQAYITALNQMKQDLDYIFKRIRMIKKKLETKYPNNYSEAVDSIRSNLTVTDMEDEEEVETASKHSTDNAGNVTNSAEDGSETIRNQATSVQSNESSGSSLISGFLQTARQRFNSTGLATGLLNPVVEPKSESKSDETDEIDRSNIQ